MDLKDRAAVERFFSNPEQMALAREHAAQRGVPVALFDAASAGLAGRFVRPLIGQGTGKVLAGSAAEAGMQAAGGAGGEAAAQLSSEGEIKSGREIFAEAISEVATTPTEVVGNLRATAPDSAQKTAESQQTEKQPVDAQFKEDGTVVIDGKSYAIQDGVLKPVVSGSTQAKAIESLVGKPVEATQEEPGDKLTTPNPASSLSEIEAAATGSPITVYHGGDAGITTLRPRTRLTTSRYLAERFASNAVGEGAVYETTISLPEGNTTREAAADILSKVKEGKISSEEAQLQWANRPSEIISDVELPVAPSQDTEETVPVVNETVSPGEVETSTRLVDEPSETTAETSLPETPSQQSASEETSVETTQSSDDDPNLTSIKNAVVDQGRVKRGLPPATPSAQKEFGQTWNEAVGRLRNDPDAGRRLVSELTENPRPLTDEENALLLYRQIEAENEFGSAQEALSTAMDEVQASDATARVNRASDELLTIYNAGKAAGTEQGRGLATRKMLAREDFTLAKMVTMARAAQGGKSLSPEQSKVIDALQKRIAETESKLSEFEEKQKTEEARQEFQRLLSQSKKEAKETAKLGKGITEFLDDQADKARERIINRRGRLQTTVDPLNVAGLVDEAIIGASYIAKGIKSFTDWSDRMLNDFGERIQPYLKDLFERSTQYHNASTNIFSEKTTKTAIQEARDRSAEGKALDPKIVYDLAREKVRSGVTELSDVMKAVQQDLEPIYEGITEREIRDAFSGYGKVTLPSKEADLVKLRELRRLGQLTSAIEDAQRKIAPMKSGPQRDKQTQEVREMQKELQRVMREQGIETTSQEQQLASTNQARVTALKNQIEDLDKQLRTGVKPQKGKPQQPSEEVERLRSERDAMRELLEELENPKRSPEKIQLDRDKKAIQRRTKETRERISRGDYGPKQKKTPLMDDEKARLLQENQETKELFWKGLLEQKLRNRSIAGKIIGGAGEALNTSRAILTSADVSAVLRQGGFITFGNPARAASSIIPMFRALASKRYAFKIDQQIKSRSSYPAMQQSKLYIADESVTSLSKMEEQYMSRWVEKIPIIKQIVGASQRAYITFLNKLRADSFDAMTKTIAKDGTPTLEESRAIANFINVATGRGDLGRLAPAATALNTVFFAPRYVASRFQLLLLQPIAKGGTSRTKKLITKEYAKTLTGSALVYALAIAAGADVEDDPRSADFGKFRFGNTRLDPLFGLAQVTVFLSRLSLGKIKTQKKELKPAQSGATTWNFMRNKFSPVIGSAYDARDILLGQKTPPGHPTEILKIKDTFPYAEGVLPRMVVPISFPEVAKVMDDQGVAKGTVMTMISLFGAGVQTYGKKQD